MSKRQVNETAMRHRDGARERDDELTEDEDSVSEARKRGPRIASLKS